jgi:hypothetical protein
LEALLILVDLAFVSNAKPLPLRFGLTLDRNSVQLKIYYLRVLHRITERTVSESFHQLRAIGRRRFVEAVTGGNRDDATPRAGVCAVIFVPREPDQCADPAPDLSLHLNEATLRRPEIPAGPAGHDNSMRIRLG